MVADTPNTPTIETLVDLLNARDDLRRTDRTWTAADTLKNVVVKLRHPDGRVEPLAVGVPGDREVDLKRLEAQLGPAEIEPFTEDDFKANTHLAKGYIGPGALGAGKPAGIRYLVDPRIVEGTQWVTGSDQPGKHVLYLTAGRDFTADGTVEAAEVVNGDPCPVCGSALEIARGIEIGHIFQLGRKYANALGLNVLDQNGKQQVVTMGSYGIGVSRAVAAIAEMNNDEKGLIWPREVAPADVHMMCTSAGATSCGQIRPLSSQFISAIAATRAGHADAVRAHRDDLLLAVLVEHVETERLGVLAAELEDVADLDAAGHLQRGAATGQASPSTHLGSLDRAVGGEVAAGGEVEHVADRADRRR